MTRLDKIEQRRRKAKEHVVLTTFNYDTFLETACGDTLGFKPTELDEYIAHHPDYSLFRPHGCIEWVREVTGRPAHLTPGDLISLGSEVALDGAIMVRSSNSAAIPAIAVPVTSKDLFECPEEHIEKVRPLLTKTNAILVIGWRAQELTFMDMLRELLPNPVGGGLMKPLIIVSNCREQADLTRQALQQHMPALTDYRVSDASSDERCDLDMSHETGFSRFVSHSADEELNALAAI
jgi:hypothetical protein